MRLFLAHRACASIVTTPTQITCRIKLRGRPCGDLREVDVLEHVEMCRWTFDTSDKKHYVSDFKFQTASLEVACEVLLNDFYSKTCSLAKYVLLPVFAHFRLI